jgi:hypothetical protein
MSLLSNFFGKKEEQQQRLTANGQIEHPLALSVLFSRNLDINQKGLEKELCAFDASMSGAVCHLDGEKKADGFTVSLAGWGNHVVRILGTKSPMPAEALEPCVSGAHYPLALKEQARSHKSHVLLYYVGYETDPLKQYVALAAVAGVLSKFGGFMAVNEAARTSFPAEALAESKNNRMDLLYVMPLMYLYIGFVKYNVENVEGVWMRTYGAYKFNIPDFAFHAAGHSEGQKIFDLFGNVVQYLLDSKAKLLPGNTMQIEEETFMRLRKPQADEGFLESKGEMLVVELINKSEINQ